MRHRDSGAPAGKIILALFALLALTALCGARAFAGAPAGATGTFGKTTLGAAWQNMTDDAKRGSRYRYDGPAGSELYQVTAPLRGDPGDESVETQTVDVAVYADEGGEPGALLAQSTVNRVIAGTHDASLITFPLAQPVPLQPGASYWLMIHAGQDGAVAEYSFDAVTGALRYEIAEADAKADGARDPAGPMLVDHRRLAIWGSFRPAAAGPPSTPPDRDADGVADADDRCPDVAGLIGGAGCPASTTPTPPDAPMPGRPQVATAPAQSLTPVSALLTGIVVPQGDTRWHFEWGRTTRYGRRTGARILSADAGAKRVEMPLTGLRPSTTYHFRLVAQGPGGEIRGETQSFRSPPLPRIEPELSLTVGCVPGAPTCRIKRSSLDIAVRGSDGELAGAGRHVGLRVRLVLRRGDRVLKRRGFVVRDRVPLPAMGGPGGVTLRRQVVDRHSRYPLGRLLGGRMAVGTALEVYVTRRGTTGGNYRYALRRGVNGVAPAKRSCEISADTGTTRLCRTRN
jgi:hypothetical protein